jgi:hypothetical protein
VVRSIWFCQITSACLDKDKPQGETVAFLRHICPIVEQSGPNVSIWMAVNNGLYMLDKVSIFRPDISPTCVLSCSHNESIEHFFFGCEFVDWIVTALFGRLGLNKHPSSRFHPRHLKQVWLQILKTSLTLLSLALTTHLTLLCGPHTVVNK